MVQVPTGGNMADINTKPLGGQRIRYFTNPFGYWHSEDQVRVGECALPKKIVRIESEWLLLRACSQWLQKHPWKKTTSNVKWTQWRNPMGNEILDCHDYCVQHYWFCSHELLWSSESINRFCSYQSLYDRLLWGANQENERRIEEVNGRVERTSDEQYYYVAKRSWESWE